MLLISKRLDAESLVHKFTNSLESPTSQPLVIQFKSIIDRALPINESHWKEEFFKAKTDFQRVCYLLKAIESSTGSKLFVNITL